PRSRHAASRGRTKAINQPAACSAKDIAGSRLFQYHSRWSAANAANVGSRAIPPAQTKARRKCESSLPWSRRALAPLGGDPSGHEQRGERRLEPIPQHQPREYRADRPQQDAPGPMFLKVEDLSSKKDAAAQGNRAHGVQRQSKRSKAWQERSGSQGKARD